MAKMPGAKQVPLASRMTQPRMTHHDIVCIHTMVGSLAGTRAMFKSGGYKGTESHFGTDGPGSIEQWVDTDYSADANYLGSRRVISIENADHGPGFKSWNTRGDNVPPFTPAQIEANAQIIAWAHKVHGIPIKLIPDTKPGRRGVGYHAQGVPGNGLVSGGISWSKARGKVCPGRRRIAQIPQIIARAKQIAAGDTKPTPKPTTTTPTKKGLFDMSIIATGINTTKRTIQPGKTARIAVGKHFSLATVKKGQTVRPTVRLALHGAHEEDVLAVSAKIVDYVKGGKPQDKIVGNFFTSDFKGTTGGGGSDHVYVGQAYKVFQTPRKNGSLRLQLLVTNKGKNPIDVRTTDFVVEGD